MDYAHSLLLELSASFDELVCSLHCRGSVRGFSYIVLKILKTEDSLIFCDSTDIHERNDNPSRRVSVSPSEETNSPLRNTRDQTRSLSTNRTPPQTIPIQYDPIVFVFT